MADDFDHHIQMDRRPVLQQRRSRAPRVLISVVALAIIAAASAYLWLNYDSLFQAVSASGHLAACAAAAPCRLQRRSPNSQASPRRNPASSIVTLRRCRSRHPEGCAAPVREQHVRAARRLRRAPHHVNKPPCPLLIALHKVDPSLDPLPARRTTRTRATPTRPPALPKTRLVPVALRVH